MKKIRFLLIDIGYDCEELNEPLGIEVLATYLHTHVSQIETKTYSANVETMDYYTLLNREKPDVIGISTHINSWERLRGLYDVYCEVCSNYNKDPVFIVGGILGTYEYEKVLAEYQNTICIIGEGEEALSKLLIIMANLQKLVFLNIVNEVKVSNCPNVAYLDKKHIVVTERSCLSELLCIEEPAEHPYLETVIRNRGIVRMESSRGCPWNACSFCVLKWKYAGMGWRPYPINKVVHEMIQLSSKGAKTIYFTDEEFLAGNYERLNELINRIRDAKITGLLDVNLEMIASTSVRALKGKYGIEENKIENLLIRMRQVGFRSFFLGIESGSNSQLKRFNKGDSVAESEDVLKLLKRCGIEADIGYILFDPLVSITELKESLEFLKRNCLNEHISRFAKRLRVVPYTSFCLYKGFSIEGYDRKFVELKYKFADDNVQKVYDLYSNWEEEHLKLTHILQAEIREACSSKERNKKIILLEKIRKQEFLVLEYLVNTARENPNDLKNIIINELKGETYEI